jgi:transposase-like protein
MPARPGTKHHHAKLNPRKVRQARKTYARGGVSIATLADRYEVAWSTMQQVINRVTWKHVD